MSLRDIKECTGEVIINPRIMDVLVTVIGFKGFNKWYWQKWGNNLWVTKEACNHNGTSTVCKTPDLALYIIIIINFEERLTLSKEYNLPGKIPKVHL